MRAVCILLLAACGSPIAPTPPDAGTPIDAPMDAGTDAFVPRDAGTDSGPPEDLDVFIEFQMGVGHVPGLAVAVIRGNEVVFTGTYGYANIATSQPVDEHTLF